VFYRKYIIEIENKGDFLLSISYTYSKTHMNDFNSPVEVGGRNEKEVTGLILQSQVCNWEDVH